LQFNDDWKEQRAQRIVENISTILGAHPEEVLFIVNRHKYIKGVSAEGLVAAHFTTVDTLERRIACKSNR